MQRPSWLAECLILAASSGSDQDEGHPEAPPLALPCPPVKAARRERAQSIPPPLRAAMLRLLRLRSFRPPRIENSRNPGRRPALC